MSEGALRGDMNCIRLAPLNSTRDVAHRGKRQTNFRIARHRQRPELIGSEKLQLDAKRARFAWHVAQGAHDAIYLRMPGIGRYQDFHQIRPLSPPAAGLPRVHSRDPYVSR